MFLPVALASRPRSRAICSRRSAVATAALDSVIVPINVTRMASFLTEMRSLTSIPCGSPIV